MNMFYTGLGIARSLGERGIPVIGLSAQRGVYGNFTRYARILRTPDSRDQGEALVRTLVDLGAGLPRRGVLFPTRDHDLVFIDRYREQLEPYFALVLPGRDSLRRCLDKWQTYLAALETNIATPRSWLIDDEGGFAHALPDITFPCVVKPLAAHRWRTAANWALVGARKAFAVHSRDELTAEYRAIARADSQVLIQEAVPGDDDCLVVAACYVDQHGRFRGGFNAQKLVQTPPGYGTGCIVQSIERPELFERTRRLLAALNFTGIAEVEYKWDARARDYKLIEVNPRPWDQHCLGAASAVDLMHLAYCDHAGLPMPEVRAQFHPRKWVAEDAFVMTALRMLWRRERGFADLLRHARGHRQYAIWSARDPLPFAAYVARLLPELVRSAAAAATRAMRSRMGSRQGAEMQAVR
jgi:predicted ATP-grasp superfamily ATP-dependent carboligase